MTGPAVVPYGDSALLVLASAGTAEQRWRTVQRLADALDQDRPFRIQIAGERFWVPVRAQFSIEHERDEGEEEVELPLKWTLDAGQEDESDEESEDAPVV